MTTRGGNLDIYLRPTLVIDSDSEIVRQKATLLTVKRNSQREKAKALFYFVRDKIKYIPYPPFRLKVIEQAKHYKDKKAIAFRKLCF